jgi:6-phosphofructokinase 1
VAVTRDRSDSMNDDLTLADLQVRDLGARRLPSPLLLASGVGEAVAEWVSDDVRVLLSVEDRTRRSPESGLSFEKAGPRREIFFDPAHTRAGIVTCGGLCPGVNSVIRSLVLELHYLYRVREILGFRFGYEGLNQARGLAPMTLSPADVRNIHRSGGSILGLGRGAQDPAQMVSRLEELEVDVLFTVGGDGTLRGAHAIAEEAARRGLRLGVVGVPKTIDNDVPYVDQTFGFDTAIQVAAQALDAAHTEATSARNGIGVVKLMGREAGFISAHAALASLDVNFCLIPEVPFKLHGSSGLLHALEARLVERGHALIVIAEGCGLRLGRSDGERDESGNLRFASKELDIGPRLCEELRSYFKQRGFPVTVKYIDPSYMIRSVSANSSDNRYCDLLARNAAHAAMAGKTDLVIGRWNGFFTHVPLKLVTSRKKRVHPQSELWLAVTSTTGQPALAPSPSSPSPEDDPETGRPSFYPRA